MNASDVLKYGHATFVQSVENIPSDARETKGVCGIWSCKDILLHILSYEVLLVEIFSELLGQSESTPIQERLQVDYAGFNDTEVIARQSMTWDEAWTAYVNAQAATVALIADIPLETLHQNGVLAWYGEDYDLEDYLAYSYYGHKREHSAEINVFYDRLKSKKPYGKA